MPQVRHVVLKNRPAQQMKPSDFEVRESLTPELKAGQFLIENRLLSLDAGFRQWMNAGASDNYLQEMRLGEPVQSIILGHVTDSRNDAFPTGTCVVGRTAWETHSIADGSDLMTIITPDPEIPLEEYLAALGPSGMTAYFGLFDIGKPKAGDIVLVSAAAGGIGTLVGQMARIAGCSTIGISSSDDKCRWLEEVTGYDKTINYRAPGGLEQGLKSHAADGIDIYFDNVGGTMLDTAIQHLRMNARLVLCGAISQYESSGAEPVYNLWELITKRARAEGFMFSDYVERYDEAGIQLSNWIKAGQLKSPINTTHGIEHTGEAFCQMLRGGNLGKSLVAI